MNTPKIAIAIGYIDDSLISEAITYKPIAKRSWVHYVSIAACLLLVCNITVLLLLSHAGNDSIDIYHIGDSYTFDNITDIPVPDEKELLIGNLNLDAALCSSINLCVNENGSTTDFDDWYSLTIVSDYPDYHMTLFCLFDTTKTLEDWKVSSVFTPWATKSVEINGTEVLIAPFDISIDYEYSYYAIFEYQNVVYDIRVRSNDSNTIYDILNEILSSQRR